MIEILIVEIIFSKNVYTFLNNKFYIKTITRCYIRIIMLCSTAIKRLSRPICNCIVFKHKWLNIFFKTMYFFTFYSESNVKFFSRLINTKIIQKRKYFLLLFRFFFHDRFFPS